MPDRLAIVPRHRCLAALRRLDRQITWIAAPAGTGKSHLLQQIADQFSGQVISMQMEESDADPGRFFHRLARSARKAADVSGLPAFGPEDLTYLRSFAGAFVERLDARPTSRVLLAFDDMHHLNQSPELLDAIAAAIARASDRTSFAIASREAPPSSWAPLIADGRLAEMGPDMLLMDADEVRALLRAHPDWQHGTDERLVDDLLAATKGWASGIGVLIALLKTRASSYEFFSRREACDIVFENFYQQIFAVFSLREQHELVLVASCPLLDEEILRQMLGPGICELLERLCHHNVLVSKDYREGGDARPRYRLHALLQDFLRHEGTKRLALEESRDFSTRMAEELLTRGEDEAARECLMEAQDWRRLASHLEEVAENLFTSGRIRSLRRFLNALPESERNRSAELRYWQGLCLLPLDPTQSRRELTVAYQCFRARGDDAAMIRAWGAAIDSIWFEWEDCARLDPFIDDLPDLEAAARRLNTQEPMNVLIKGAFAALSLRRPDHPDFKQWEEQNLALFQRRLPKSETVQRGLQLMIHYVYGSGERRKAELVLSRLRQIYDVESESITDHCVYHVVNAAYQFWFSPEATQAPATVITGLTVTERLGTPFWDVPMLNAALFRLASDEHVEGLRNMLAMLEERLPPEAREHDIAICHHFVAYLAWLEGDPEKAAIAIEAACRIAQDSGFCLSPVYYGVGRAAVLAALGRRREAFRWLRAARQEALRQNSRTMTFMSHMAGAAMALRAGRAAFALSYVRPAFALGAAEGFRAVPWVRVADRNELCNLALKEGITPGFAAAFKIATPAGPAASRRPLICTLGRADIMRDGRSELISRKPQVMPLLLMLHLVAAGRNGRSGDQLIDALWPDADMTSGRHRLKTTLYRLRKLVGDQTAICSAGGRVKFDDSSIEIDAWSIERLIATHGDSVETAEEVIGLYQGGFVDLYTGHMDLVIFRERMAQEIEGSVLRAGEALMMRLDWDRAACLFQKALDRLGFHGEILRRTRKCLEMAGRKEMLERFDERWIAAREDEADELLCTSDLVLKQPVSASSA